MCSIVRYCFFDSDSSGVVCHEGKQATTPNRQFGKRTVKHITGSLSGCLSGFVIPFNIILEICLCKEVLGLS